MPENRQISTDRLSFGESVINGNTQNINLCASCNEWYSIPRIMNISHFIGWKHPNIRQNCFDYARAQLNKAGYDMKSPSWGTNTKINPFIYQLILNKNVAGMQAGVQKQNFIQGVKYLKESIKNKIPVIVGIDLSDNYSNIDGITDHFVIIVGMGIDQIGNYFLFDDNATGNQNIGTSNNNRLYCKCSEYKLQGKVDDRNNYGRGKTYTVTQIRESKSLKATFIK